MNVVFTMMGLPETNARLDKIAMLVANPITRDALQAGGEVIEARAEALVHRLTGMLAGDIVIVTRMRAASQAAGNDQKYVLIGPGWNPDLTRHAGLGGRPYASKLGAIGGDRGAPNRSVPPPDSTTNPGVYGYFLEFGHRAPGHGLARDPRYRRDAARARKKGQKVNTHDYGHLDTPPYPWLQPAFEQTYERAFQTMKDLIEERLAEMGL